MTVRTSIFAVFAMYRSITLVQVLWDDYVFTKV